MKCTTNRRLLFSVLISIKSGLRIIVYCCLPHSSAEHTMWRISSFSVIRNYATEWLHMRFSMNEIQNGHNSCNLISVLWMTVYAWYLSRLNLSGKTTWFTPMTPTFKGIERHSGVTSGPKRYHCPHANLPLSLGQFKWAVEIDVYPKGVVDTTQLGWTLARWKTLPILCMHTSLISAP